MEGMVIALQGPIMKAWFNFVFGLFIATVDILLNFAYLVLMWILQLW